MAVRPGGEAESVLPDTHTGMDVDPIAEYAMLQGDIGADLAVRSQGYPPVDHRGRTNQTVGTDFSPILHDSPGFDPAPGTDRCVR